MAPARLRGNGDPPITGDGRAPVRRVRSSGFLAGVRGSDHSNGPQLFRCARAEVHLRPRVAPPGRPCTSEPRFERSVREPLLASIGIRARVPQARPLLLSAASLSGRRGHLGGNLSSPPKRTREGRAGDGRHSLHHSASRGGEGWESSAWAAVAAPTGLSYAHRYESGSRPPRAQRPARRAARFPTHLG